MARLPPFPSPQIEIRDSTRTLTEPATNHTFEIDIAT
ncbi:hypothetical protein CCACVL1_28188 [Corchorus capsularis]|uniref:Uncharacterized protein n=1 Tax=Corchorus capsularis TaxID=210143 RepID=A0A1R3G7A5_COCAP|nr:hypothetical protein CCACVL1_28188 [Corchorus capsularis]